MSTAGATIILAAAVVVAAGPHVGVTPHDPPPGAGQVEVIRLTEISGGREVKGESDATGGYFGYSIDVTDQWGVQVGRLDACAANSAGSNHVGVFMVATLTLPGGQIVAQNLEQIGVRTPDGAAAITGGTGKYTGVGGQLHIREHGDRLVVFVRLTR